MKKDLGDLGNYIYYRVIRSGHLLLLPAQEILVGDIVLLSKNHYIITFDCFIIKGNNFNTTTFNQNKNVVVSGSYVLSGFALAMVVAVGTHCFYGYLPLARRDDSHTKLKNYDFIQSLQNLNVLFYRDSLINQMKNIKTQFKKGVYLYVDLDSITTDIKVKGIWRGEFIENFKGIYKEDCNRISYLTSLTTFDAGNTKSGAFGTFLNFGIIEYLKKELKINYEEIRSENFRYIQEFMLGDYNQIVMKKESYYLGYYKHFLDKCTKYYFHNNVKDFDSEVTKQIMDLEKKGYLPIILCSSETQKLEKLTIELVYCIKLQFEPNLSEEIENYKKKKIYTCILSKYSQLYTDYVCTKLKINFQNALKGELTSAYKLSNDIIYELDPIFYQKIQSEIDNSQVPNIKVGIDLQYDFPCKVSFDYGSNIFVGGKGTSDFIFLKKGFVQCLHIAQYLRKYILKDTTCKIQ